MSWKLYLKYSIKFNFFSWSKRLWWKNILVNSYVYFRVFKNGIVTLRLTKNNQWLSNGFFLKNTKAKLGVITHNANVCDIKLWCYYDNLLSIHWERVCKQHSLNLSHTTVTSRYSQCIWGTMKIPNVNAKIFNDDRISYIQRMNW